MILAVVDTNVLVSSFMRPDTPHAQIREAFALGRFEMCMSRPLLEELEDVLSRRGVLRYLKVPRSEIEQFLVDLPAIAVMVPEDELHVLPVTDDPDDDVLLATAVAARAHVLVSGDEHLRALRPQYQGISVLEAAEFAEALRTLP